METPPPRHAFFFPTPPLRNHSPWPWSRTLMHALDITRRTQAKRRFPRADATARYQPLTHVIFSAVCMRAYGWICLFVFQVIVWVILCCVKIRIWTGTVSCVCVQNQWRMDTRQGVQLSPPVAALCGTTRPPWFYSWLHWLIFVRALPTQPEVNAPCRRFLYVSCMPRYSYLLNSGQTYMR